MQITYDNLIGNPKKYPLIIKTAKQKVSLTVQLLTISSPFVFINTSRN